MSYSTITQIRDEAGFTGNNNIADSVVTSYQSAATSHIDSVISRLYTLPLSSTPAIIELIERKLAAGHLLLDEYGETAEGTSKDGNAKIKWAEQKLAEIEDGLIQLVNVSGVVLSQTNAVGMRGWPDNTTGVDRTADGDKNDPPITEIGMKF